MTKDSWQKFGKAELEIVKRNHTMTAEQLKELIKQTTGMDVSRDGVSYHLVRIREEAEAATRASSASIDAKVSEFFDININDYMKMLDDNIRQIDKALRGEDSKLNLADKDSPEETSKYWHTRYSRLLGEQIQVACELRPQIEKVEVAINSSDDIDEKMKKYEELFKSSE